MDPFSGGGTTTVEALAAGRRALAFDINALSSFIATAKTTPLTPANARAIEVWLNDVVMDRTALVRRVTPLPLNEQYRNVPWWLRATIHSALGSADELDNNNQRCFARAVLLRTAQWALDGRKEVPDSRTFRKQVQAYGQEMLVGIDEFSARLETSFGTRAFRNVLASSRKLIEGSIDEHYQRLGPQWRKPKLILTSPPYWDVHILYHRWQVQGRRETPAPYWITGTLDGHGAGHYTFGNRNKKDKSEYLSFVTRCFGAIRECMGRDSIMVQLVGFADPSVQMPLYLRALESVGLEELTETKLGHSDVIWRDVPQRKWYTTSNHSSREFLLLHRRR